MEAIGRTEKHGSSPSRWDRQDPWDEWESRNLLSGARLPTTYLTKRLLRDAVNLNLDVMVHLVGGVAIAIEADVAALGILAIGDETEAAFDVGVVRTLAQLGDVLIVVVIDGGHTGLEVGIVGNLDDHALVGALLRVIVPDADGVDGGGFLQVDLDPLRAFEQFDEVAFASLFVAVGDELEVADDRIVIAAGDLLVLGQQHRFLGNQENRVLVGRLHQIGHVHGLGRAFDEFGRIVEGESHTTDGAARGGSRGCGGTRWFLVIATTGDEQGGGGC